MNQDRPQAIASAMKMEILVATSLAIALDLIRHAESIVRGG